jgi:SPP1 family predicted phage head-tail adaptor
MRAGELDRRIDILRATITYNAFQEAGEAWAVHATVWASRKDVRAGEAYRAAEVGAEITTRFTVRLSSLTATVTARDRIRSHGRDYNITAVREIQRNAWLEIDAAARVGDGIDDPPPADS